MEKADLSLSTIILEEGDGAAVITLNRPQKLNAIDTVMRSELNAALQWAGAEEQVRVILIKGAGRAFSSGADINDPEGRWLGEDDAFRMHRRFEEGYSSDWLRFIWENPKLVVAQVHGYCLGLAMDLVNNCDFVVASHEAVFERQEIRMGGVLTAMLPWVVGIRRAKELLLLGRRLDAQTAHDIGLITTVVDLDELDAEVSDLVERIVNLPPEGTYFGKLAINRAVEATGLRQALQYSYALNVLAAHSEDAAARKWASVRSEKGASAALKWRDSDA